MPSTVEQLTPSRVKLTIEMPFTQLKSSLDKAYREIAASVTIPGFRKGKVPPAIIDQRFGRGMVLQEAINDALPGAYQDAVNQHNLIVLGQPEIDVTKLEDGDLVEFTAEVDVRPDFEMPDFSSISVEVPTVEVSDADVEERVELLRQRFAENADVERAASEGDVVVIDLEGSIDGEVLEDATATGITYRIGSGGMLDGLDDAVTGLSATESATFTSTLLGGPHKDEDAEIRVTVQKVMEQTLPAVDDDFAQLVSEFDSADEMRADLRSGMDRSALLDQAAAARDKVLEQVIAKTDFDLPQGLVTTEVAARKEQVTQQLREAGLTLEQYLADSDEETDDVDVFWADIEKRSIDALKAQIVLDKYADDKEVGVSQSELTELIFSKARQNGSTPEQEVQHMMDHGHMSEWMHEIRRSKALSEMVAAASVKDAAGNDIDLSILTPASEVADLLSGDVDDDADIEADLIEDAESASDPTE